MSVPGRPRPCPHRGVRRFPAPTVVGLVLAAACGSPSGPDEIEDYDFVISGPAGVAYEAEITAWAREDDRIRAITALHVGELTGDDLVWEANSMVRASLRDLPVEPPNVGDARSADAPRVVTEGDRTATVLALEIHFFTRVSGDGPVQVTGRVSGETRIRRLLVADGATVTDLRLGETVQLSTGPV